jgi:hypothetical protein
MTNQSQIKNQKSRIQILSRLRRALVSNGDTDRRLAEMAARLERIERQLESVHKIWLRTRHVEPAVQAVLRQLYVGHEQLPYPERLLAQRFRLASQNQEDGLTIALLKEAGIVTRTFVEIGSGLSGGNSAFLSREWGWTGLMVDGGGDRRMQQVGRRFPGVVAVNAWVTRDNIDALIGEHGFGGEVDVFSLDLDGNDYWIWDAVRTCSPRIVILEYNSMFGSERAVTVAYDPQFDRHRHHTMYYGASLAAWVRLGAGKGYRLVAVEPSGINAFFLRNDLAPHIPACDPARAFRIQEKHDVWQAEGLDVYRYCDQAGLPLVDVDRATL